MASAADLLRIENLDVAFSVFGDRLRVVKEANLRILPGKVTALVGESGSGKSVISQSIMYLAGSFLMFLAFLNVIGVLISDIALGFLDPRIRLQGRSTK